MSNCPRFGVFCVQISFNSAFDSIDTNLRIYIMTVQGEGFLKMVEMEEGKAGESDEYVRPTEARKMFSSLDTVSWHRVRSTFVRKMERDRVFYSMESIERAIEKRNNPLPVASESDCRHHWMIPSPNGEMSPGKCKSCGEVRDFRN